MTRPGLFASFSVAGTVAPAQQSSLFCSEVHDVEPGLWDFWGAAGCFVAVESWSRGGCCRFEYLRPASISPFPPQLAC